jgi:hypothetical protein
LAADANGKASLTLSNGKGLDRIALVAKDEFSWVNFLDSKGQFASGMIGTGNGKSWYEQRTADKKNNFFFDFNVARLSYEWAHQERGEEFRRQAKLIGVNNLLPRTQRVIEEIGGLDQFTQPLPNLTSASP